MGAVGFVLVCMDPGEERGAYKRFLAIPGLREVFPLFGEYDFILKMEARDFDELGKRVVKHVRTVPGVMSTSTLTVTKL